MFRRLFPWFLVGLASGCAERPAPAPIVMPEAEVAGPMPAPPEPHDEAEPDLRKRFEGIVRDAEMRAKGVEQAVAFGDRTLVDKFRPDTEAFGRRYLAVAEADPKNPVALDALTRAYLSVGRPAESIISPEAERGRAELAREVLRRMAAYADDPRMAKLTTTLSSARSPEAEALLRVVLEKNPDRDARGRACQTLAEALADRARAIEAKGEPSPEADALGREAEALHGRVAAEFAEVKAFADAPADDPATLGEASRDWLAARRDLAPGKPAPATEGTDLEGKPLRLADFRGKVVVLAFWSSLSRPSVEALAGLAALAKKNAGRPFAVVGVDSDFDLASARKVLDAPSPTLADGDPLEGKVVAAWHVRRYPTVYLLDADGVIRGKDLDPAALAKAVGRLLDATPGKP